MRKNYDEGYIKVYPKSAGDFGFVVMSLEHEDDRHLQEMAKQIKRNVDGVATCKIVIPEEDK